RAQAQCRERRGQPGRHRRQLLLERGGRGAQRRPCRPGTTRAAGPELARLPAPVARGAHALPRRRGGALPGGQQQRLLPGRAADLAGLAAPGRSKARLHPPAHRAASGRARLPPASLLPGARAAGHRRQGPRLAAARRQGDGGRGLGRRGRASGRPAPGRRRHHGAGRARRARAWRHLPLALQRAGCAGAIHAPRPAGRRPLAAHPRHPRLVTARRPTPGGRRRSLCPGRPLARRPSSGARRRNAVSHVDEFESDLHRTVLSQLDRVAGRLSLDPDLHVRLRAPRRALVVSVPVRMDTGRTEVFTGYRVHHSTVLGPTKGGLRYDEDVSLGEVTALAMLMSWKCALMGLPYGGAKGGVRCNPRNMSLAERENLTRRYTAEIILMIGPDLDIPAPDLGTDEQTMAWMMDTYSMTQGKSVPGVVTGKPLIVGGSAGRREATGRGIVYCLYQAARHLGQELRGKTVVVQGFGNVGAVAARLLWRDGAVVTGVSDVKGAIWNPQGLDIRQLEAHIAEAGSVVGFPGAESLDNASLLERPCDILIPAAIGSQIHAGNADRIRALVVAEGAN